MTIETERLILRPFEERDASDVFEYLEKPQVNCFACMKLESLEAAREEMVRRSEDTEYTFAIVLKETGKVIGEIDAHPEATAPDEENAVRDTFSPCWMLNKAYHGKGYAYEAKGDVYFRATKFNNPPCLYNVISTSFSNEAITLNTFPVLVFKQNTS